MIFGFPSRLYAIASLPDPHGRRLADVVRAMLEGGVRVLQLRWKGAPSADLVAVARELRDLTSARGALFFVNDRADVAAAVGADGVHLGQEDLPIEAARRILGRRARIGVSTHDLDQARAAERAGADYIGFGPIFATASKGIGHSPRGLERLREARGAVRLPIVAIGGIRRESGAEALAAGADAVAMISELAAAADVTYRVREVLGALDSGPR